MARVPTPMRLSKLLASLQLNSTVEPTPGAGDVLPRITACAGYLGHPCEKIGMLCMIDQVSLPKHVRCEYNY